MKDYATTLNELYSIVGTASPKIRGRGAVRSPAVNIKSALSNLFSSRLAPRYEETTCQALGSVIDAANGFRVHLINGVNWSGRFEDFASNAMSGLANRVLDSIMSSPGYDGADMVMRGIVASHLAMLLSVYSMGATWRERVGLIIQSALNTLMFDIALDMSRNLYTTATWDIADGAGHVVLRIVGPARKDWTSAGNDY